VSTAERRAAFTDRVRARAFCHAPGVYDMVSATVADSVGFDALYMSGYGISASHLGLPDAGLTSFAEMLDRARTIAGGTQTPLIADADTGFGGLVNVRHTVQCYEQAGVAAIQLEDQDFPKKCGHAAGRTVIPTAEMVRKVAVAVESRTSDDFLIIARTDARSSLGIDEAIARGQAYAAAGADVVFVESPESEDEFARVVAEIDAPVLANMVEGGFSPVLSADRLAELGVTIGLFPVTALLAVTAQLQAVYMRLRADGIGPTPGADMQSVSDLHGLMGLDEVQQFEERWND
jgi:2-methylisocitrate lyase-like PEP mutase family enzyme